jgi:hypothetical protein
VLVAHTYNPSYLGGRFGKIAVQSQPRQKVCEIPFQPIAGHGGRCLFSQNGGKRKTGGVQSRLTWENSESLSQKYSE